MNTKPAFPVFGGKEQGDPNYNPDNLANPYNWNVNDYSRGLAEWNAPSSNSTMVSDSVEMTRRLRAFVPDASVQKGRTPQNNLGYAKSQEEVNRGDYKSSYR